MPLSEPLARAIADSLAAVDKDPRHHLRFGRRNHIYRLMGPEAGPGEPPTVPWRRRIGLAISSVERALPVWMVSWPADRRPQRMIELISVVLKRSAMPDVVMGERNAFMKALEAAGALGADSSSALLVGLAAIQALNTAIFDGSIFARGIRWDPHDPEIEERDADPEDLDAAYFAACATAGGSPDPPHEWHSDPDRRREYWIWWLKEAVPAAFESDA